MVSHMEKTTHLDAEFLRLFRYFSGRHASATSRQLESYRRFHELFPERMASRPGDGFLRFCSKIPFGMRLVDSFTGIFCRETSLFRRKATLVQIVVEETSEHGYATAQSGSRLRMGVRLLATVCGEAAATLLSVILLGPGFIAASIFSKRSSQ